MKTHTVRKGHYLLLFRKDVQGNTFYHQYPINNKTNFYLGNTDKIIAQAGMLVLHSVLSVSTLI